MVGIVLDGGREKGVDEGSLAQSRFTSNLTLQLELYSSIHNLQDKQNVIGYSTIIVKAAPLLATILCRWFGKLAMPIGDALSAVAGGMVIIGID